MSKGIGLALAALAISAFISAPAFADDHDWWHGWWGHGWGWHDVDHHHSGWQGSGHGQPGSPGGGTVLAAPGLDAGVGLPSLIVAGGVLAWALRKRASGRRA